MALEVGLWRVDGDRPIAVKPSGVPLEAQLEAMIEQDPTILGAEPLLLIGRQVATGYGTFIDLLAVDENGTLHVLELKRDRTPREVIAQVLDYGSWITQQTHEDVLDLYTKYKPGQALEAAWAETFSAPVPQDLNSDHRLTVVAGDLDSATERIVSYLAGWDVPVNVVMFRYFNDDGRAYLARTWLMDDTASTSPRSPGKTARTKEPWNGLDWYVSFGEESGRRNWDDARRYGFVSAGGGDWFSKTLRKLPEGGRVFACIPKLGYVGVGTVIGPAQPFTQATVTYNHDDARLAEQQLQGTYTHAESATGEDTNEWVVPVQWIQDRPREKAFWRTGMFANQNSACKLTNKFTLDQLAEAFSLDDA